MNKLYTFRIKLKELLSEAELQPNDFAEHINVSSDTVRLWLRKNTNITYSYLIKIVDYFQCSVEYLIGNTENFEFIPKKCPPFYENLRKVMKEKGVTRYGIVRDTNIYDGYFTKWAKGAEPNLLTLITLSEYLQCSVDYIIGRE